MRQTPTIVMDAIYFAGCAGWLHRPAASAPRRRTGVVLCSALGRDERCTHRPLRVFADRLAADGFPVLRFDYPGQGDSEDLPGDALPAWLSAIHEGRRRLAAACGLDEIVLGGLRLGASLALLAAEPGDTLMLLAPVVSGRSWIAKLRFSAAQGRRDREGVDASAGLDADGLLLSPTSCAGLASVDLLEAGPPLGQVLLAIPGKGPRGLEPALSERASSLSVTDFPGYERLFIDPNDNEAPTALFDRAADWLAGARAPAPGPPLRAELCAFDAAELAGAGWRERPVSFGDGLRGVLTRPAADAPLTAPDAVVFFNTGGDPKAGIGRFAAHAARALAESGRLALRFDFAGVGDSPEPPGVERIHVYETPREPDLDGVFELLGREGAGRVFVVGISAGGFHAFWTLLRDPRVSGAFCISTIKLVWRTGDAITIGARRWGRPTGAYLADLFSPGAWARLMRGEVAVRPIASSIAARVLAALKPERLTAESRALRHKVRAAAARGASIGLLMGREDAALDEVEAHFGRGGRGFRRLAGMSMTVIEGLDHGLVYERSRVHAFAALQGWLDEV